MQMKRLRFKANAMSKREFEDKMNMLKASLLSVDNQDLEGISFDKMKEFEDKLGLLPVDEDTKRHGMEATYQERIKAFEDNLEEKNKKAEDFVRKMSAERRERMAKKKHDRKKAKAKMNELKLKQKEKQEKDLIEKAELRKELEEEIRDRMRNHERYRQEMKEKWDHDRKEISNKKYMHQSLEENYRKKIVIPSLEKKKELLRKKREHFAPIRHKDLVEHEKVYVERLKQKLREKKEKREKWYQDIGYGDYDPSQYQSKYLSSVEHEASEPLVDFKEQVNFKWDKRRNYAKFVKEMHKPKVSVKKQKEMKYIVKEVEKGGMSRQLELTKGQLKQIEEKQRKQNERPQYENYIRSAGRGHRSHSLSVNKPSWMRENPMVPKPKLKRKGYVVDYLLKKRIKREQLELEDPDYTSNKRTNWDRYAGATSKSIRSLSNAYDDTNKGGPQSRFDSEVKKSQDQIMKQRLESIKAKAKQIEEEAIEKEKNMKLTTGTNVKDSDVINSLLIDSIEAKLHLLKDI